MKNNRREFIKASVLGTAAAATGALSTTAQAAHHQEDTAKQLDILVLGGTGFIGPHMVREALRRGHSVTLFNRGRTNNEIFPDLETIKGDRGGDLEGLKGRRWDVVIDNSGYVPRHVENSATLLADVVDHYLFISTVSVYASFAEPMDEDSPLGTIEDETIEEVNGETYGPLKVLCEKRATAAMGEDRITVLRPTYICGPGDHTDRFSYWPVRTSMGGAMLWPGSAEHTTQIIDVRDLAHFTIDCVEKKTAGVYNTCTPRDSYTFGQFLEDSVAVTAADIEPVWVDEAFIEQQELFGSLPVWHPMSGEYAHIASASGARARAAGLRNRPVRETIRDLLHWWETQPDSRTHTMRAGLSLEREAELIELYRSA
ncbi:MAG: NAD-dependent epimerase/dehydratase family protein [Woeseiaceae bacterium]|nr:NAD-dependent epimerase/dehydratase family protein [Woeseiaceae bacterium]